MKRTIKIGNSAGIVGIAALGLAPLSAPANTITGSISFNGNVTPYVTTDGTGALATDYSQAHSLVFGQTFVSTGANGSFSGVTQNSMVSMYSPLVVNPAALPAPTTTPLWTTAIGNFSFTLTTLTEDLLVSPFNTLTLRGTGTMSDGNPLDTTTGTWVATFTEAASGDGSTFSWGSSSTATVPEAAETFILLGVGCIALGAFSRFQAGRGVA